MKIPLYHHFTRTSLENIALKSLHHQNIYCLLIRTYLSHFIQIELDQHYLNWAPLWEHVSQAGGRLL